MACRWERGGGPGRRRGGGRAQNEENARGAFSGLMIDDNPLRVFCVSRISFLWIFFNLGARLFSFFLLFFPFFSPLSRVFILAAQKSSPIKWRHTQDVSRRNLVSTAKDREIIVAADPVVVLFTVSICREGDIV